MRICAILLVKITTFLVNQRKSTKVIKKLYPLSTIPLVLGTNHLNKENVNEKAFIISFWCGGDCMDAYFGGRFGGFPPPPDNVANSGAPKPGNGVATFLGGTAVQKGDGAIVLNYNFTQAYNGGNKIYRNNFVPVLRMGLGDKWDINIVVPQMYQVQKGGKQGAMYGSTGVVELIIHKQHLAEQVGESAIMLASNYIIAAPTTAGMNGAWGFGFDLGLTWIYDSMRFVFDFRANTNSQTATGTFKNPSISIKAGYHYAFIDYLYAGIELNYDTIFYRTASRNYNADGSHILYIGPMLGVKIPELKGLSFGVGFFWDCLNYYQHSTPSTNPAKVDSWRVTSRVTAVF